MDYKKKYKEALGRARAINNGETTGALGETVCEFIFPELKESEDERIRKAILALVKQSSEVLDKQNQNNMLAWLEKQVESIKIKKGKNYLCTKTHKYAGVEWIKDTKYYASDNYTLVNQGCEYYCPEYSKEEHNNLFEEVKCDGCVEKQGNIVENLSTNTSIEDDVRRRSTIQVLEYARSLDTYNQYGKADIDKNISWLEKQVHINEEKVLIGARKDVALSIMNFLDRCTTGMCLSNMECADLEDAVVNSDWSKVYGYMKKKLEKQGEKKNTKSIVEIWKNMRLEIYQQASGNRHEPNYSDDTTKMFSLNDIDEIFEKIAETCEQKPVDYENTTIVQKDFAPKSAMQTIKEEKIDNTNKVEPKDYNSIDPHFGKPTDKVEPKFYEGEWIVWQNKCYKVNDNGCGYELIDQDGLSTSLEYETVDTSAHLWGISDVKDGDVLIEDSCIFIIQKLGDNSTAAKTYCTLYNDGDFNDGSILYFDIDSTKPATKEQRDTLERAMADAGYTFDFEKKELKKLGQSEVTKMSDQEEIAEIPFGAKDSELQEATYFIPKGFHAEIDDDKVVIKKGEKPTAWSEEDMSKVQRICKYLNEAKKYYADITEVRECMDWLKSLKDRYTWKPTEEQIRALHDLNLTGNISYGGQGQILIELYNNLKKLTE